MKRVYVAMAPGPVEGAWICPAGNGDLEVLRETSAFMRNINKRQGLYVIYIEEIVFNK